MKYFAFFIFFFSLILVYGSDKNDPNKWRGPSANGIYDEPGLLTSWPKDGPDIIWVAKNLGNGFSSPVFANNKIYVSGEIDHVGYIFILDEKGEMIKKVAYGKEFTQSYPGSRATPVVIDNTIYMHSGEGIIYAINETTGEQIWTKDLFNDFDGKNLRFGVTESLVIEGNKLYVTPGGEKHSLVALDRKNGELLWSVTAGSGLSAYCTPLLFEFNNEKMITTMMGDKIIGVDRENGNLKWAYDYRNQRGIHPNTPIYSDGELFYFSGYGHGGIKLKISAENNSVQKEFWTNDIESKMGGAVLLNGVIYGSGDNNRGWHAIDWKTGNLLYKSTELGNGVVIAANQLLYKYTDRGELALVKPGGDRFEIISTTKVEHGTAQHWAHPVIYNGVLYIRHGDALIAYKITE